MKTKNILTAVLIVAGSMLGKNIHAQAPTSPPPLTIDKPSYKTAIGLRAGETSGLTIKHFLNANNAMEGIVRIWPNALSLTGLYERHVNAGISGLNWYYGGGGHFAFDTGPIYYVYEGTRYYRYSAGEMGIGLDGIMGVEYKITPIPFAFSLDIKPFFEVNSLGHAFISLDPGVGIKIAF